MSGIPRRSGILLFPDRMLVKQDQYVEKSYIYMSSFHIYVQITIYMSKLQYIYIQIVIFVSKW